MLCPCCNNNLVKLQKDSSKKLIECGRKHKFKLKITDGKKELKFISGSTTDKCKEGAIFSVPENEKF